MGSTAARPGRDARRREILEAAFLEFAEAGYARTSMAAIARRARASKETLYAWFDNKEELFNTVFASRLEGMTTRILEVLEGDRSPAHVLQVVAEDTLRFELAITPLTRAMGAGEPGERALELVIETIHAERNRFANYLLWCRERGHVAFDDDPLELVSLFVVMARGEWGLRLAAGLTEVLTDAMIEAHAARVVNLFLKALAPPTSLSPGA